MTTQPPEAGDLRSKIADIVLDAIQNAASGEASDSGYLDRDHANDATDRILALSPAPSQGDVEAVARALDPAVWADDLPALTRAEIEAFHQARQRSCEQARRAIAAMAVSAEVERLRESLRPFASLVMPPAHFSNESETPRMIKVADLRRAARALSDDDGKEGR